MHQLDGPKLKLHRAAHHLKSLNEFVRSWQNAKPFVFSGHAHPNQPAYVYTIELSDIAGSQGVVIGDVLHNLHSALDNITWQLALLTNHTPYDKTAFPIFNTNKSWAMKELTRLVQDVPEGACQVIRGLQPYNAPNPSAHPLWLLHQLSDCDKHRSVTLTSQVFRVSMKPGMEGHRLNEHTIDVTIPMLDKDFPPPPPEVHCDSLVITDKGGIDMPVEILELIHGFIRDCVFPRFVGFFPE